MKTPNLYGLFYSNNGIIPDIFSGNQLWRLNITNLKSSLIIDVFNKSRGRLWWNYFKEHLVCVHVLHEYSSIDTATAWNKEKANWALRKNAMSYQELIKFYGQLLPILKTIQARPTWHFKF